MGQFGITSARYALDPSNGRCLAAYAVFLDDFLARREESRSVLKRALSVDPMSPNARFTNAEFSLDDSGIRVSERKLQQVLELDPNFVPALYQYAEYLWVVAGKLAEAIQINGLESRRFRRGTIRNSLRHFERPEGGAVRCGSLALGFLRVRLPAS